MEITDDAVERVSDSLFNSLGSAAPLVQIKDGLQTQLISVDEAMEELECQLSTFNRRVLEKLVSKLAA